jgi:hypothetical protein
MGERRGAYRALVIISNYKLSGCQIFYTNATLSLPKYLEGPSSFLSSLRVHVYDDRQPLLVFNLKILNSYNHY